MRDVEQRLGKPETGEDTQSKQKQIVKQIDTLIQQMKQSGSSGSMAMRQGAATGSEAGRPARSDSGANAAGAPPMKPAKPRTGTPRRAARISGATCPKSCGRRWKTASRKTRCPRKAELIRRYYLSVAKQKLVRGE